MTKDSMTYLDNVKENLMTHKVNIKQAADLSRNIHLGVDTCYSFSMELITDKKQEIE